MGKIAEFLDDALQAAGVEVVVQELHLSSMMSGVKKQNARVTTTKYRAIFAAMKRRVTSFFRPNPGKGRPQNLHLCKLREKRACVFLENV